MIGSRNAHIQVKETLGTIRVCHEIETGRPEVPFGVEEICDCVDCFAVMPF